MYCKNLACPSQGRFTNRDVQAACNIVDRFICAFVLGGKLGLLSAAVLI
jgi:transposase